MTAVQEVLKHKLDRENFVVRRTATSQFKICKLLQRSVGVPHITQQRERKVVFEKIELSHWKPPAQRFPHLAFGSNARTREAEE
jgi:hypothetical protein